ncbi:MAG: DNA-directed RNA polymerase subunit H [Candidatus Methanofastidiosia archaeon]
MRKVDIREHELVPGHIILKDDEVVELLKRYNVRKDQLPLIKSKDPVVKLIGAKVGDVLKIVRKNSPAGEAISYRVVIE